MEFTQTELKAIRMALKYAVCQQNESIAAYNNLSTNDGITEKLKSQVRQVIEELNSIDQKIKKHLHISV